MIQEEEKKYFQSQKVRSQKKATESTEQDRASEEQSEDRHRKDKSAHSTRFFPILAAAGKTLDSPIAGKECTDSAAQTGQCVMHGRQATVID